MVDFLGKWYHKILSRVLFRSYRCLVPLYSLIELVDDQELKGQFMENFDKRLRNALHGIAGKLPVDFIIFQKDKKTGSNWNPETNYENLSAEVTKELNSILSQSHLSKISSDLPLLNRLNKDVVKDEYRYGIAFSIQNQSQYLILTTLLNDETIKIYDLLFSTINQLQIKSAYRQHIEDLDRTTSKLEGELEQKQSELRQTERSLKKRVYEINNLLEISSELYSILDLKQLVNSALLTIVGQIGCQKSLAMIYEPSTNSYSNVAIKGINKKEIEGLELEVDHPVVRYLLDRQRPVSVKETKKNKKTKDIATQLQKLGLELVAPIVHSDRLKGIIGCGEKLYGQDLDDSDVQIFTILVNILSISLSNAQIYEEVKKMSFTDGMTGLNNYRYFENRLREEINRAKRNGSKLSLIMLDIDHFKNYNDTLGHQAGDEALRTLAWVLKNTARDDDIVNRYGGEEFSIILPGLEKERIEILAERIREKVEEHPFYKEHVQPEGKITISIGAATFPNDADEFDALVNKADKALYKAKDNGRNKFVLC